MIRRILIGLAAALVLAAGPAAEAQKITVARAASGAATNPNLSYEAIGYGSGGDGSTGAAHATLTNTMGTPVQLTAATGQACAGYRVFVGRASALTGYGLKLSFDGGATYSPMIYLLPGTSTSSAGFFPWPQKTAAGVGVYAQLQNQAAAADLKLALQCEIDPTGALGFSTIEAIHGPDAVNTRASSTNVTVGQPGAWVSLGTTSNAYKALLAIASESGVNPSTAQNVRVDLATGASGSETIIYSWLVTTATGSPRLARGSSGLIQRDIPAGTPLSVRITAPAGTDNLRVQVLGAR